MNKNEISAENNHGNDKVKWKYNMISELFDAMYIT